MNYLEQSWKDLTVELDGQLLWVTLNRPQASNAYSSELVESLITVLRLADEDRNVRVMILTRAGKNFCAGGDIKAMKNKSGMFSGEPNELREAYQNGIQKIPRTINHLKTPIIAMINGAAVGAGCDLAAMCDLRIASEEASFAETFAKVGLVPGDGGAYFLIRAIGFAKAMEMFLTGKTYSALEAKELGLVTQVIPHTKLREETRNIALKMSEIPPIALQMTKKSLLNAYHSNLDSHLELVSAMQGIAQRTEDHFTALEGMMEKKKKTFKHF